VWVEASPHITVGGVEIVRVAELQASGLTGADDGIHVGDHALDSSSAVDDSAH
jgi:hypothetical protein